MKKTLLRFVVFLLVPAFILADPAVTAAFQLVPSDGCIVSTPRPELHNRLNEEALSSVALPFWNARAFTRLIRSFAALIAATKLTVPAKAATVLGSALMGTGIVLTAVATHYIYLGIFGVMVIG